MSTPEIALIVILALIWLTAAVLWLVDEVREIRQWQRREGR